MSFQKVSLGEKREEKKHDAELRFEAAETDENLPENGNFGGRRRKGKKKQT